MAKALREIHKQDLAESIQRTQKKWERQRNGYKDSLQKRAVGVLIEWRLALISWNYVTFRLGVTFPAKLCRT